MITGCGSHKGSLPKHWAESTMHGHPSPETIEEIAAQHGAKNIRIFGSHATGKATVASDLELLVEPEPGRDLLDLIGFKQAVEEATGIRVDVLTEKALSPYCGNGYSPRHDRCERRPGLPSATSSKPSLNIPPPERGLFSRHGSYRMA